MLVYTLVLSLALATSSLASPSHGYGADHTLRHRGLAPRVPEPVAAPNPVAPAALTKRRIGLGRRDLTRRQCRSPRPESAAVAPEPESSSEPESEPSPPAEPEPAPEAEPAPSAESEPEPEQQSQPEPEQDAQPEPEPEQDAQPEPEQQPEPQPEPEPQSQGETFTGEVTFYSTGLGACGGVNTDTDFITAVSASLFDSFPGAGVNSNLNPICGRQIRIDHEGRSVTVAVVDRCVGCAHNDLDLSPSAFSTINDFGVGRFSAQWQWV